MFRSQWQQAEQVPFPRHLLSSTPSRTNQSCLKSHCSHWTLVFTTGQSHLKNRNHPHLLWSTGTASDLHMTRRRCVNQGSQYPEPLAFTYPFSAAYLGPHPSSNRLRKVACMSKLPGGSQDVSRPDGTCYRGFQEASESYTRTTSLDNFQHQVAAQCSILLWRELRVMLLFHFRANVIHFWHHATAYRSDCLSDLC